ncbi:MAG: hypothetical protein ACRCYY_05810 [Trueperaceae bacterium]
MYGLFDELWHSIYGFDVTLQSPPHVGIFLAGFIIMVSCVVVFTSLKSQPLRLFGVTFSIGLTLVATVLSLQARRGAALISPEVATALVFSLGLVLAMSILRQQGAAFFTALTITLFQVSCWFLIPPITRLYADSLGLFLRDYATGNVVFAILTPLFVVVAALGFEGVLWLAQKLKLSPQMGVIAAGSTAAVLIAFPGQYLYNLRSISGHTLSFFPSFRTVIVTLLLSVGVSYFAWLLGSLIRRQAQ